jgi:hypothetical protein
MCEIRGFRTGGIRSRYPDRPRSARPRRSGRTARTHDNEVRGPHRVTHPGRTTARRPVAAVTGQALPGNPAAMPVPITLGAGRGSLRRRSGERAAQADGGGFRNEAAFPVLTPPVATNLTLRNGSRCAANQPGRARTRGTPSARAPSRRARWTRPDPRTPRPRRTTPGTKRWR